MLGSREPRFKPPRLRELADQENPFAGSIRFALACTKHVRGCGPDQAPQVPDPFAAPGKRAPIRPFTAVEDGLGPHRRWLGFARSSKTGGGP
jgi:hypothetical protein